MASPDLTKLPIFNWHATKHVASRRERLVNAICDLAPTGITSMLDVGAGDGTMTKLVADRLGATDIKGVDVKLRPGSVIDVRAYDGLTLPFEDARFDLVTIVDVLHHCTDMNAVFAEIMRVVKPTGTVIVKDHFQFGRWSDAVLWAMDMFGNSAFGVKVRGNYLSPPQWVDLVSRTGGSIEKLVWPFKIHNAPITLVARSEYQFLMRITKS
jgi:SAM-dependent methyltransferase